MATWTYEEIIPTPIANTTVERAYSDGVHRTYRIKALDGYVLHDNARDWVESDPFTMEEVTKRGYTRGSATCGANYDFNSISNIEGYIAHGSRGFFARPESEVPADQIFGGGGNHEVM